MPQTPGKFLAHLGGGGETAKGRNGTSPFYTLFLACRTIKSQQILLLFSGVYKLYRRNVSLLPTFIPAPGRARHGRNSKGSLV